MISLSLVIMAFVLFKPSSVLCSLRSGTRVVIFIRIYTRKIYRQTLTVAGVSGWIGRNVYARVDSTSLYRGISEGGAIR